MDSVAFTHNSLDFDLSHTTYLAFRNTLNNLNIVLSRNKEGLKDMAGSGRKKNERSRNGRNQNRRRRRERRQDGDEVRKLKLNSLYSIYCIIYYHPKVK